MGRHSKLEEPQPDDHELPGDRTWQMPALHPAPPGPVGLPVHASPPSRPAAKDRKPWVRIDRRYNNPYRLTGHGRVQVLKWLGVTAVWLAALAATNWLLILVALVLTWLAAGRPGMRHASQRAATSGYGGTITPGFEAAHGISPEQVAAQWQPEIPANAPVGERNSRTIPQDVKVAVAARDGGRCRECGSTEDIHFDHVIPWSRGGANTVNNIQLLCGPCNRAKSDRY
jgi:hypothetical protein